MYVTWQSNRVFKS